MRLILFVLIVTAALTYTNAGNWLWTRISPLGQQCYDIAGSSGMGNYAQPVCGGLSKGIEALGAAVAAVSNQLHTLQAMIPGQGGLPQLARLSSFSGDNLRSLIGTQPELLQMIAKGPQAFALPSGAPPSLSTALNSFSIGQNYLGSPSSSAQGVAWLQAGASQPQGFGIWSQLALGNYYAQNDQNLNASAAYLTQAQQSLSMLQASSGSNPQAAKLLKTLPMSPAQMATQIEKALGQVLLKSQEH